MYGLWDGFPVIILISGLREVDGMDARDIMERVRKTKEKYGTSDPFELLDAMGVYVRKSDSFSAGGLKGFCYFVNRVIFVVINDKLDEHEQRIVAMHEAAHVILHRRELSDGPIHDFGLFDMVTQTEAQANYFTADYLIEDEDVFSLAGTLGYDFFQTCQTLCVPPDLMTFKLYSMAQRGRPCSIPLELDSRFLSKRSLSNA